MTPATLIGYFIVPLLGTTMCAAPTVTRPTLQFGVRVPPARVSAAVIARERRAYFLRTAAVCVCATVAVIALAGRGSWWPSRLILLLEIAADLACFWLAHREIKAVKAAESWFAGLRQTVIADTSWRTRPQPFPVRWVIPAVTVIAATAITGAARYPHLPAHLTALAGAGGRVPKSPGRAFAAVIGQLYVTTVGTGLLMLIHRSRPDIDTVDPAGSLRSYRMLLTCYTRAALIMFALIDVTLLLAALQLWRVYQLSGAATATVLAPTVVGMLILIGTATWAGRQRARLANGAYVQRPGTDRDDDRFWKAGLIYINRDDPAIAVPARFGVGWALNLANPAAWLTIAGTIGLPAGLLILRIVVGL